MKYVCPRCGEEEPEVKPSKVAKYCNECHNDVARNSAYNISNEVESRWDVQLSFEWLHRLFGRYSAKHLRKDDDTSTRH